MVANVLSKEYLPSKFRVGEAAMAPRAAPPFYTLLVLHSLLKNEDVDSSLLVLQSSQFLRQ